MLTYRVSQIKSGSVYFANFSATKHWIFKSFFTPPENGSYTYCYHCIHISCYQLPDCHFLLVNSYHTPMDHTDFLFLVKNTLRFITQHTLMPSLFILLAACSHTDGAGIPSLSLLTTGGGVVMTDHQPRYFPPPPLLPPLSSVDPLLNETKCHLVSFSLVMNQTKWHLVWSFPN